MIRSSELPTSAPRPTSLRRHETTRERRQKEAQEFAALKERQAADQAERDAQRSVIIDARITALQADGAIAIGGHIMQGVVRLDDRRRQLAGEDITRNMLLSDLEAETVNQVKRIQRSFLNPLETI